MNRLVYLFELDSAKTSRAAAEDAEFAIFHEIIKNGNKVVLSMNQFVDSRVMAAAVYDENGYKYVRRLFDDGALKVSLYGDVCSVSQYVQNAIDKCLAKSREGYIFTTLPVRGDDREMLTEIKNSLQFSDLTNINKLLDIEFLKLRVEDDPDTRGAILENIRKLKITLRFLSLVLRVSTNAKSSNPPKPTEGRSFLEFLKAALDVLRRCSFRRRDINNCRLEALNKLEGAMEYFESEGLTSKQKNRRTNWLKYFDAVKKKDNATALAIEIINICYNYAVQDTILGASKQYDDNNFKETFRLDFIRRVNKHWLMHNRGIVVKGRKDDAEFRLFFIKQWKNAASIGHYNSEKGTVEMVTPDNNRAERRSWYTLIMKKFAQALAYTAAYTVIFCMIGFFIDLVNGALNMPTVGLIFSNLGGVVFVIMASVILSFVTHLPSALECAVSVVRHIKNIFNAAVRKYDLRAKH